MKFKLIIVKNGKIVSPVAGPVNEHSLKCVPIKINTKYPMRITRVTYVENANIVQNNNFRIIE